MTFFRRTAPTEIGLNSRAKFPVRLASWPGRLIPAVPPGNTGWEDSFLRDSAGAGRYRRVLVFCTL